MCMLKFFDCNCCIGMRGVLYPDSFYKMEDLKKRLSNYGIQKVLVYHSMAREYNPVVGNEMITEELANHPYACPVWVVMHHNTGEFPEPYELMTQMKSLKIKVVRMFPSAADQNFSIAGWNCGKLFKALEEFRIPVMLGLDQLSWNELYEICSVHPELRLILTDVTYRIDRNLYSLLKEFKNLHIETSGYKVYNGIEEICSRFGAERLIFGSGMPVFSGAAAVSMINYARIGEKEKAMIASENMEKMIGGVRL